MQPSEGCELKARGGSNPLFGTAVDKPIVQVYTAIMSQPIEGDSGWAPEAVEKYLENLRRFPRIEPSKPDPGVLISYDEAKNMLGENFLGPSELSELMTYLSGEIGIKIDHVWYPDVAPMRNDVEFAKQHSEMALYLPSGLELGNVGIPSTVNNISGVFKRIYCEYGEQHTPALSDIWYRDENFAADRSNELSGFIYMHRKPLSNTQLTKYEEELAQSNAGRRKLRDPSALEVVLTELVYFGHYHRMFFPTPVLTRSLTNNNQPVYFSGFNSRGFVLEKGISEQARHYPVR